MANSIVTNSGAQAAIRSLFSIDRDNKTTSSRIESGLRVNAASDDPAVFSIAQGMRADMAGLKAVQDGQAFGLAAINVANVASKSISDKLTELKQTITQGQQQGLDKETMNAQAQKILEDMDTFANSATYNGINLLVNETGGDRTDTTLSFLQDVSGRKLTVENQSATVEDLKLSKLNVDAGGISLNFGDAATDFADGDVLSFTVGEGTAATRYVFEFNQGGTAVAAGTADLNTSAGPNQKVISVNLGTADDAYSSGVEIGNLMDALKKEGFGARRNNDGTMDIFGADIQRVDLGVAAFGGAATATVTLSKQTSGSTTFYAVGTSTAADGAATTAGNSSNVIADGKALVTVLGGTLTAGTAGTVAAATAATRVSNVSSAIDTVNSAISSMNSKLAVLGSATKQVQGLQSFSKSLMDSLKDGLGALVDADLAEESARLQSLQARQQLAIQSLSMANQQPQSLLSLFR